MATSPTQRSLALLRKEGWRVAIAEKWIAQAMRRIDLFGFIDLVAIRDAQYRLPARFLPGQILGVQCTTMPNLAAHIAKARALPEFDAWLRAGGLVEFHGWAKRGPRGKRKLWTVSRLGVETPDGPLREIT